MTAALLVAAALVLVGYAGYQAGNPGSVDLASVRAEATAEGREAGAREGEEAGYAEGFKAARERSYRAEYAAAYREAYVREFERAGLTPPESILVRGAP